MKKTLALFVLIFTFCIFLSGCGECEHVYDNACDTTCNECNAERAVTHDFAAADCTAPKTCKTCGKTEGEPLVHTPEADDGDCTTAVKCSLCDKIATEAKATHTPEADDGDCTTAVKCSLCEKIVIEAKAAHTPEADDGDCTTAVKCSLCDKIATEAKATHTPESDDGDCTTAVECTVCDKVAVEAKAAHTPETDDNDCATALTCEFCDHVFVEATNHQFNTGWNATHEMHWHICLNGDCQAVDGEGEHIAEEDDGDCTTDILCKDCGWCVVEGNDSHTPEADDGDCTTAVKCSLCEKIVIEAKAVHTSEADDGDCTTAVECTVCDKNAVEAREEHSDSDIDGNCDYCEYKFDYVYDQENDTYIVFTAAGLYAWAEDSWKGMNMRLANDIVLPNEMLFDVDEDGTNDSNWEPLSVWSVLDGDGHSISGLVIKTEQNKNHIGFISSLTETGVVKNLSIVDADIKLSGIQVAILVAYNSGLIENCSVSGRIYSAGNDVAGIAGVNSGTIIACHNEAEIIGTDGGIGGIVGQHTDRGKVIASYNTGEVTTESGSSAGGISCSFYGGSIIASYSNATVTGPVKVGGIAGYCSSDSISVSNYWNTPGETPIYGMGFVEDSDNTQKIDGEALTWGNAMSDMNAAIEAYNANEENIAKCNYRYALNTDALTSSAQPLILVPVNN